MLRQLDNSLLMSPAIPPMLDGKTVLHLDTTSLAHKVAAYLLLLDVNVQHYCICLSAQHY